MADPYAERAARAVGVGPGGEPPWEESVAARLELLGGAGEPPAGRPVGIVVADECVIPPITRLDPAQGAMLAAGTGREPAGTLASLGSASAVFGLKHGTVAGPEGEAGARPVSAELLGAVLDADARGEVRWERDPDFGWEVAAEVPGVGGGDALALLPRLLYAEHDRVYEHAELVVATKRRFHERLGHFAAVPAEVAAATGWPIEPTGEKWKDR